MSDQSPNDDAAAPRQPTLPRSVLGWIALFGPGAIIASLTIGTGELIFSTRGGALFGYRILFLFTVISILKWALVLGAARHIVLTGVHPYQRMLDLPGPRGWLPLVLFLIAAVCMPIWVSFHSGVLGNFTSWLTGTSGRFNGGIDYLWGAAILTGVLLLSSTGGYERLEKTQLLIVAAMVFCAGATLFIYGPNWLDLLYGAIVPQPYVYPDWLKEAYPKIAAQPEWVETTRYVGVIGGASFDYMVYTSYLREKAWGAAGSGPISNEQLEAIAADPRHPTRLWLRAPYIDCTISFVIVVAFSAVFVASGALVLGPNHRLPDEENLLNLQAEFVTNIHPWLLPLYVAGAFLTMLGTLYGTLEVACAIAGEMARSASYDFANKYATRIRRITMTWCAVIAFTILLWMFLHLKTGESGKPRVLLDILTPANLFTGVLGCGIFCFFNVWIDKRYLPGALRMPVWLLALNLLGGVAFFALGAKGYWDNESFVYAVGSLAGMLLVGIVAAAAINRMVTTQAQKEIS